jgi:hypothetical protein
MITGSVLAWAATVHFALEDGVVTLWPDILAGRGGASHSVDCAGKHREERDCTEMHSYGGGGG